MVRKYLYTFFATSTIIAKLALLAQICEVFRAIKIFLKMSREFENISHPKCYKNYSGEDKFFKPSIKPQLLSFCLSIHVSR